MSQYDTPVVGGGVALQSGIPKRAPLMRPADLTGVLLRGVVLATYVTDDPNHPFAGSPSAPLAVYCDVLTYGRRQLLIPHALVSQEGASIHSGAIWRPRAATMDITGAPFDPNKATNPANMDGDHVLVGFLDGNSNQPIILRSLPHPAADSRLKITLVDGDPRMTKHHGVVWGVKDNGDYLMDTTAAYSGDQLQPDGSEPPPTAGAGNQLHYLPTGATWYVDIAGATLEATGADATAKLVLGDGTKSATIAEQLQTWWDATTKVYLEQLRTLIAGWVPLAGDGGAALKTALAPWLAGSFQSFPTNAISTKVKMPNG